MVDSEALMVIKKNTRITLKIHYLRVHQLRFLLLLLPIIGEADSVFETIKVTSDYKNILLFIENMKMKLGLNDEYDIQCGYEAGCLGYSLYN